MSARDEIFRVFTPLYLLPRPLCPLILVNYAVSFASEGKFVTDRICVRDGVTHDVDPVIECWIPQKG